MIAFVLRCIALCILGAALVVHAADEKKTAEVLRAHSPDKKFAMRIICDPEHADADEIPGTAIHSAAIVTLPGKQEAAPLLSAEGLEPLWNPTLVWSADSQWCAFYSCTNRVGYTTAFRRDGERFVRLPGSDDLSVPAGDDTRNEHISPVRWLKPGVLLLEQHTIPRREEKETHVRFTAAYDAKAKKFRISGVKKVGK
jgi:hypothetical protein